MKNLAIYFSVFVLSSVFLAAEVVEAVEVIEIVSSAEIDAPPKGLLSDFHLVTFKVIDWDDFNLIISSLIDEFAQQEEILDILASILPRYVEPSIHNFM